MIDYGEVILLRNVRTIFLVPCIFRGFGFLYAPRKVHTPTQGIIFLGYHINTLRMTITLTFEKKQKIKERIEELLKKVVQ